MDRELQPGKPSFLIPIHQATKWRPGYSNSLGNPQNYEEAFINCWPHMTKGVLFGDVQIDLVKRPGIQTGPTVAPTIASYGSGAANMSCRANVAMGATLGGIFITAWFDSGTSSIYIISVNPTAGATVLIGTLTSCLNTDYVYITPIVQQTGGTWPAGTATPAFFLVYSNQGRTVTQGYYAISSAGVFGTNSLTVVTDASFPANTVPARNICGFAQQLDGVTYVMTTDGMIWGSGGAAANLFDCTTWSTLNYAVKSMYPDRAVSLYRYKNLLLCMGLDSIQYFQTGGGATPPASVLTSVPQAFVKFGGINATLARNVDDVFYFLAYSSSNTLGVWKIDGYVPTKISTPKIDTALGAGTTTSLMPYNTMDVIDMNYRKHLIINLGTYKSLTFADSGNYTGDLVSTYQVYPLADCSAQTMAMDIEGGFWWGLSVRDNLANTVQLWPAVSYKVGSTGLHTNYVFLTGLTSSNKTLVYYVPNVFVADQQYYDSLLDNTLSSIPTPITAVFQPNTQWFGTDKRKRINKMKLLRNAIFQTDSNVYTTWFAYNRDDAALDSGAQFMRQITIPAVDNRNYITNLGMCRNISVGIIEKSMFSFTVQGIELDIDQGTS